MRNFHIFQMTNKLRFIKLMIFVLMFGLSTNASGQVLWSATSGSGWLLGTNWVGGIYPGAPATPVSSGVAVSNVQYASFNDYPAAMANIDMSNSIGNGYQALSLGGIEINRTSNLKIQNSSTLNSGTLFLFGSTQKLVNNVVLKNVNTGTFTIDGLANAGLFVSLNNTIENIIDIDASGGITIDAIVVGSNALTKSGTGTGLLTLSANNTYSGSTTINAGVLSIGNIANGGIASGIGASSNLAANITLAGGTLQYTGVTSSTDRNFILAASTTSSIDVAGNTLTISGAASATNGAVTKLGAGTLMLTGANLYTGITSVNAGTLQLNKTGGTTLPNSNNVNVLGGTLKISTDQTLNDVSITTGNITVDAGATLTINGSLTIGGIGSITNNGTIVYGSTGSLVYSNGTARSAGDEWPNVNGPFNLILNNAATNISLNANKTVLNNITINHTAVLTGTGYALTVLGDWFASAATAYNGGTVTAANTSEVIFNGIGSRSFTHSGGAAFRNLTFSGSGTYSINNDITVSVNTLTIANGIVNMGTNTLAGSGNFTMIGGLLQLAKTNTILPELLGTYNITGGTIELNAAGNQILLGSKSYANLTFSNAGIKTVSSAINPPTNTILGTVTIADAAILDVANNSMGGAGTNLTMTGNGFYRTAGTATKPDARGTYTLAPSSTIEFYNNVATQQDIRLTPDVGNVTYGNVVISGTNVGISGAGSVLKLQALATFKVTNTGVFNVQNSNGFTGSAITAINNSNNPTISLLVGSTINYNGNAQTITNTLPYQNITLSGTGIKTAPSTTLSILGNIGKTTGCTFAHNGGTVSIDGTMAATQTYSAVAPVMEFNNLINNNTNGGFTIANDAGVENLLTLNNNSKLIFGLGNIHLRSSAIKTAAVDQIGLATAALIDYTSVGRFVIERYLEPYKSWRLLATPIDILSSPTVSESWRENNSALTSTGYGTQITGPSGPAIPSNTAIFDVYTPRGSMKSYNALSNSFLEVTNANTTAVANKEGYFIFVRGDRGVGVSGAAGATTLRMKGKLVTGTQTYTFPAGAFYTFGNPYASRIDFRTIYNATIAVSYYVWNPNPIGTIYNAGKYECYTNFGDGNYRLGNALGPIRNFIESGQAVFVQSTTIGSFLIKEVDKAIGSTLVSRNEQTSSTEVNNPTLEILLYSSDTNAGTLKCDQAVLNFDASYSPELDNMDVRKISNSMDNLALKSNNKLLIVERRPNPSISDSIFLSLTSTRIAAYRLQINPSALNSLLLRAFVKDKFLQTETAVSLTEVTNIDFTITSNVESKMADRFMIFFRAMAVLPVSFTTISAEKNNNNSNTVKWSSANEINIASYNIERSNDGTSFIGIGNKLANNSNSASYLFIDAAPLAGTNYYRVKAIFTNGVVKYSDVVKVVQNKQAPNFKISPNPVVDKMLHINFENMQGTYQLKLIAKQGSIILNQSIIVSTSNEVKNILLKEGNATGVYDIIIIDSKGSSITQTLYIK